MDVRFFTLMVLVGMCFATGLAYAEEETPSAVKSVEQPTSDNPVDSIDEALKQEVELGMERALKMRGPRDAHMSEINTINAQLEARKKAILSENETAAELSAEIAELDKELAEKSEALSTIFDTDKGMLELWAKQVQAQAAFGKSQMELREEIARQHRERRQLQEKARQAAAAKAAAEAEKE